MYQRDTRTQCNVLLWKISKTYYLIIFINVDWLSGTEEAPSIESDPQILLNFLNSPNLAWIQIDHCMLISSRLDIISLSISIVFGGLNRLFCEFLLEENDLLG